MARTHRHSVARISPAASRTLDGLAVYMKSMLTTTNFILVALVLTLAGLVLFVRPPAADDPAEAGPDTGPAPVIRQIAPASPTPATSDQSSEGPSSRMIVPINNVDPMTGKAVSPGCPAVEYKSHIIGFCCKKSPAYNGGWEQMAEADKDAFVARFVK